jgi:hypothetical protein
MNQLKLRVLGKDKIWRYGVYPNQDPEMSGTVFTMEDFFFFLYNRQAKWRRETLGRYAGLIDENKKEIYEDDIISLDNTEIGGGKWIGEIMFNTDQTLSNLEWGLWTKNGYLPTDFLGTIKVLGNRWQNPKLLK